MIRSILIISAVCVMLFLQFTNVFGSDSIDWNTPERIPGLVDNGVDPYYVSDPTGKIHVFHTQYSIDRYVIMYSNWIVGVGWTVPVDIIALDIGQARVIGAFVDDMGMMNIIFLRQEDLHTDVFYSKAYLKECMRATAWSKPIHIAADATTPATAGVVSNQAGYIVIIYAGNEEGIGLYCVKSYDYGETWSSVMPIYRTTNNYMWPTALKMIITEDEMIHVVWALADILGNGLSVLHTSLISEAVGWNNPTVLAEAMEYEADTPNIIDFNGRLFVIYHNDFPTTRFMVSSDDDGETWSSPTRLFDLVGSNGPVSFVVDSNNSLHMFFGNRDDATSIHGLWHSIWLEDHWSPPIAVVSGPQIIVSSTGEEGFDPSFAQSVISQGNLLFLTWRHDPAAGPINIWFTYMVLDAPILPTESIPTPTPVIISTMVPEPTMEMVDPIIEDFNVQATNNDAMNTGTVMFISIAPVVIFTVVFLILRRKKH